MIYAVSVALIVLALLTVSLVRSFKLKTHKDFMVADRQLSVWVLMIYFAIKSKGFGGWLHELVCAPFGSNILLWPANLAFNIVEYVSKPLSHSLRLFGNMFAGEIIFILLWVWGSTGLTGTVAGTVLGLGWAIFHILIVVIQAFIFMMLTVAYISMAHEHH